MAKRSLGCVVILRDSTGERRCVSYYGVPISQAEQELEEIGDTIVSTIPFEDILGRVSKEKLEAFLMVCGGLARLSDEVPSFYGVLNALLLRLWENGYETAENHEG